jgi:uncharacterized glyoxalase superfamily protein PhnB
MNKIQIPSAPEGYRTINPFIICEDAEAVINFTIDVFNGSETADAKTYDTDGLILHSEIKIGDSIVSIADRKPDWPYTPSLLQVYVDDIEYTLKKAEAHNAIVITKPTDFYGDLLARIKDKQGNLWWISQHVGEVEWTETESADEQNSDSWAPSKETIYIHDTLLDAMRNLGK